jgi:hypothetical protein
MTVSATLACAAAALIVLGSAFSLGPAGLALFSAMVAGLGTLSLVYYGCAILRASRS